MDDKALKIGVIAELEWEPSVDADDIGVTVEDGIVRLFGHVPNYAQRLAAEGAVKRIKGVRGYVDDIEIRPFVETYTDEGVAERAANVIGWDVSLPKDKVKVKVSKGYVTLTGEVDWEYQRQSAELGVKRLLGVRGVTNLITLKPHVRAGDVKHRIEQALERQAELEASNIQVTVDGATVRLNGKVKAFHERGIAERAAWAAPGVLAVEDHMTISF